MRRRAVLITLAVVLALVGTVSVYTYLKGADSRALAGKQASAVWMVSKRIPAGTPMSKLTGGSYVTHENIPASARPSEAVNDLTDVPASEVALAEIPTGQVLLRSMFGAVSPTTGGLSIPDGMIAVSVPVSSNADVAGYVQPGSYVALFDTFILLDNKGTPAGTKEGGSKTDNWATKLLLPKVKVLAVAQKASSSTKSDASGTTIVTLAVMQADAERVIHIVQTGNLYLALLSEHSTTAPAPGVDNQSKLGPVFPGGITAQGG